jgi:hypothetical protein
MNFDPEKLILNADFGWKTTEGKALFEMRRKKTDDGHLYYLFITHEENMDEATRHRFNIGFRALCMMAEKTGVGLFSFAEIAEKSKLGKAEFTVLNYATGKHEGFKSSVYVESKAGAITADGNAGRVSG